MKCCFITFESLTWFEKVAESPADDAQLRYERWILGLAAHPGVVTLAGHPTPAGGRTVLRTRAVPGRPLATMDELTASEVAGLGAALATTVADLHDAGITHGRLGGDHILVDASGRPVLCGFSEAAATTCSPVPALTADVVALCRTLAAMLGAPLGAGDPSVVLARLLREVTVRSVTGGRRGSARRLAERLDDVRLAPRLPSRARRPDPG